MSKYLTWERHRRRYVFQIRIPVEIRSHFGNRSTIRKHIGDIRHDDALVRADQFASHYKSLFEQYKLQCTRAAPTRPPARTRITLLLNADVSARFVATWHTRLSKEFIQNLESLRGMPDAAWLEKIGELEIQKSEAQKHLSRRISKELQRAISEIESDLCAKLEGTSFAFDTLTDDFNNMRLQFSGLCISVLKGEMTPSRIVPDPTQQLPIVDLWGNPAMQLSEKWRDMTLLSNGFVNPLTFDKYQGIAKDLEHILTRRPVESINGEDLRALRERWKKRGNQLPTIKDKLDILKSMLRHFMPKDAIEPIFEPFNVRAPIPRAKRLPFTDTQLKRFCESIFHSDEIRQDDKALLAMMLLLGARVEEVYQLRTSDFEHIPDGWIVRIADHRQTGHGNARLKNSSSARRIPVRHGVIPLLDAWIDERMIFGGFLFPDGSVTSKGARSGAASKRLNRIVRKLFPDDRRLVLQSTRNTISRAMRRSDTDIRVRKRLLGHADVGVHESHYDPGILLDDSDLESASDAIGAYLRTVLGIED